MPLNGPLIRRREVGISAELQAAALPAPLKRIYANRGITDPAELLLTLDQLHPPPQLKGVQRLLSYWPTPLRVIAGLIVGDRRGWRHQQCYGRICRTNTRSRHLVPNRFEFGYGLNETWSWPLRKCRT